MRKFEKVSRVSGIDFELPKRSTKNSAGYDFINPEQVTIQAGELLYVKTGIKAAMYENEVLILANRSSNPMKKGLVLINGIGVIDADYYDNPDNEGEIAFAFMNTTLSPVTIEAGEKLGQGIFIEYFTTEDDDAEGTRMGGFGSTGK